MLLRSTHSITLIFEMAPSHQTGIPTPPATLRNRGIQLPKRLLFTSNILKHRPQGPREAASPPIRRSEHSSCLKLILPVASHQLEGRAREEGRGQVEGEGGWRTWVSLGVKRLRGFIFIWISISFSYCPSSWTPKKRNYLKNGNN